MIKKICFNHNILFINKTSMTSYNRRFSNEIDTYNRNFEELNDTRKEWLKDFDKDIFILSTYSERDALFVLLLHDFVIPINIRIDNVKAWYPFRAPTVKIGIYDYKELLKVNNISLKYLNIRCLCCSTLLCGNNWSPHKTIYDILIEVKNNLEIKLRSIEIFHAIKVIDKYLGDAFRALPILEFL